MTNTQEMTVKKETKVKNLLIIINESLTFSELFEILSLVEPRGLVLVKSFDEWSTMV